MQLSAAFNHLGEHLTALGYAQQADRLLALAMRRARPLRKHVAILELRAIALHNACACHEHLGRYDMALGEVQRALECVRLSQMDNTETEARSLPSGDLLAQLSAVEASVRMRAQQQHDNATFRQSRLPAPARRRAQQRDLSPLPARLPPKADAAPAAGPAPGGRHPQPHGLLAPLP